VGAERVVALAVVRVACNARPPVAHTDVRNGPARKPGRLRGTLPVLLLTQGFESTLALHGVSRDRPSQLMPVPICAASELRKSRSRQSNSAAGPTFVTHFCSEAYRGS